MSNNKSVLSSFVFLFILFMIFLFHAEFTIAIASCECHDLCEEFKCYSGNCTQDNLTDFNCMNWDATLNGYQNASSCPVCPACFVMDSACVDSQGDFIYSVACNTYFQSLVQIPYCSQGVSGYIMNELNRLLPDSTVALETTINNVSYAKFYRETDLYNYTYTQPYHIRIPRCNVALTSVALSAYKSGYESQIQIVNLSTEGINGNISDINFTLPEGSCHVDCTDSFGRCNPDCDGFTIINSTGGEESCNFYGDENYSKEYIMGRCAFKPKGTNAFLSSINDEYRYIQCCEGPVHTQIRPISDIELSDSLNLIVVEKPVTIESEDAVLRILYWE